MRVWGGGKIHDLKMQDLITAGQITGHENAQPENEPYITRCRQPTTSLLKRRRSCIFVSCIFGRKRAHLCYFRLSLYSTRRPSAGRQDSRSTTPAVIVDVGIGLQDCPLSATERFPSPRHEHGTVCQLKWRHQIPCKLSKPN